MQRNNKGLVALIWSSADKIFSNGLALIISIILARLIEPSEYGILATASIFTIILALFVEPGMTSALIQKKNSDKLDFSTIQTFNIGFGICLYLLLFLSSNPISIWLDMPLLSSVIRVMGLQIIIGGINSVQIAYVQKNLLFKKYMLCSIMSVIIGAVVAILMAYAGFGVWALVAYNLIKQLINVGATFFLFHCRFGLKFSKERFVEMFPFASKILFTKFIDQGYVEVTQMIISKKFSATDLAYYNKGKSFPELIMNSLNTALSSVLFPYFSDMQEKMDDLKKSIRGSVMMTSYICIPMMAGLCACSETFVRVVLTEKWISSVPFLQLYCVYYICIPFSTIIQQSLKAVGKGEVVLKLEVLKFVLNITSLIILLVILKSPIAIALSVAISYSIAFFIECIIASSYLNYGMCEIAIDFVPSFVMSCVMGGLVFMVGQIAFNTIMLLVIQIIVGIVFYFLVTYVLKFPQVVLIKNLLKKNDLAN